ncbi:hypothetical protein [Bradyrhizobium murdochi]|uniref:hypothetical protein n=1 Tax=Bradyrhizobium murdochi TaxID=1038859 RepID=UPI0012EB9D0A|nr:hypothetical protein [Bradyrhizobium murdochi]
MTDMMYMHSPASLAISMTSISGKGEDHAPSEAIVQESTVGRLSAHRETIHRSKGTRLLIINRLDKLTRSHRR